VDANNLTIGRGQYRLGGRREFSDTNSLTISQSQLANTPSVPAGTLRQNFNPAAYVANPTNTFIVDDPSTTVKFGGADTIQTIIFNNPSHAAITYSLTLIDPVTGAASTSTVSRAPSGNVTDPPDADQDFSGLQSDLNSLANVKAANGNVVGTNITVKSIPGVPYGFIIDFGGIFAGKDIRPMTATQAAQAARAGFRPFRPPA